MDIISHLNKFTKEFNLYAKKFMLSYKNHSVLYRSMNYGLMNGGKRIRPFVICEFSKQLKISIAVVLDLVKTSANLLLGGIVIIVFVTVCNASLILGWIYDDIQDAIGPFQFLMLGFFPIGMNFIFGTLLSANGNLKILNSISIFGIIARTARVL